MKTKIKAAFITSLILGTTFTKLQCTGTQKELTKDEQLQALFTTQLETLLKEANKLAEHQKEINKILSHYKMTKYFNTEAKEYVTSMCKDLGHITEKDIYSIIHIESGGNPAAVNKTSGASGLIQWTPSTASKMGYTVEMIRSMTVIEQLKLAKDYLMIYRPAKGYHGYIDLYLAVFYPRAMGQPNDYVIGAENSKVMKHPTNAAMSSDGKQLTKGDVVNWIAST
jgi:hypothetical protein